MANVAVADGGRAVRAVARHVSQFIIDSGERWQAQFDLDKLDLLLVNVVRTANVAHRDDADALLIANDARHPISLMAVAQSMHFPYETVRRRVAALCDAKVLRRCHDGLIVPFAPTEATALLTMIANDAADLRRVVDSVAAEGHLAAIHARTRIMTTPDGMVAHAGLEFAVRVMQSFVVLHGGFMAGVICAAIVAANVRHLIDDPILGRRFATEDRPPPDEQRRPITLRALARATDLPFETIRRQTAALATRGFVEPRGGGWIVPVRVITGEPHAANNRFIVAQFDRMLTTLSRR